MDFAPVLVLHLLPVCENWTVSLGRRLFRGLGGNKGKVANNNIEYMFLSKGLFALLLSCVLKDLIDVYTHVSAFGLKEQFTKKSNISHYNKMQFMLYKEHKSIFKVAQMTPVG